MELDLDTEYIINGMRSRPLTLYLDLETGTNDALQGGGSVFVGGRFQP